MRKNRGFTLAEVLVTLAVIGVVGALTIPALTQSYEKQSWITGYKAAYSILENATGQIAADNSGNLTGLWSDSQTFYEAYEPYFNTVKKCENEDATINCFASEYFTLPGGSLGAGKLPIIMIGRVGPADIEYSIITSNGMSIAFYPPQIVVDINGKQGPNTYGKDCYAFYLDTDYITIKHMANQEGINESTILTSCPSDLNCSGQSCGVTCGIRIIRGDYGEDY